MLIAALLSWWYRQGWLWVAQRSMQRVQDILENFSVGILLRTLFAPWKQIVSQTGSQSAVGVKMRALVDNLISRLVGFMVRIFVLMAATVSAITLGCVGFFTIIVWPLVPLLLVVFLLLGIGAIQL